MFRIQYAEGVAKDLRRIRTFDRARALDEIEEHLTRQPTQETRNRKLLRGLVPPWDSVLPVWELRVGQYRVFYDADDGSRIVQVRAIRRKPPGRTTGDIL